MQKNAKPCANN
jgi:hypothetical protein